MLKIIRPITSITRNASFLLWVVTSAFLLAGASPDKTIDATVVDGRDYISLHSLTSRLDIEDSFDTICQKGRLYYKNHYMVYKTGYSVAIIDNSLFTSTSEVLRINGDIYIPADMALALAGAFFNDMDAGFKNGKLMLIARKKEEKPEKERSTPMVRGRIGFIILDAGHGGKDPGAMSKGGLREKDLTLKIAQRVRELLKKETKINIRMTRSDDRFIELAQRTDIANRELKKDVNGLFVSIHVNASISPRISGFETYFLSQNPTNDEARKTAALENNVIILEKDNRYDDVEYMEALMMTTQIQKESGLMASLVQKHLDLRITEFKSRGVHKADFFVLRGALMPAVLVETGFITNKKESSFLKKSTYQEKIARGICDGILNFIKEYNKMIEQ